MRSRAVSLPLACWASVAPSPGPVRASARIAPNSATRARASVGSAVSAEGSVTVAMTFLFLVVGADRAGANSSSRGRNAFGVERGGPVSGTVHHGPPTLALGPRSTAGLKTGSALPGGAMERPAAVGIPSGGGRRRCVEPGVQECRGAPCRPHVPISSGIVIMRTRGAVIFGPALPALPAPAKAAGAARHAGVGSAAGGRPGRRGGRCSRQAFPAVAPAGTGPRSPME